MAIVQMRLGERSNNLLDEWDAFHKAEVEDYVHGTRDNLCALQVETITTLKSRGNPKKTKSRSTAMIPEASRTS